MLLKAWEKHTRMSMKGEKRGFSGRMAHWMVCKVLKRKGYYVSSPVVRNAPVALDPGVVFPIEVQPTERVQDAKLLTPFPIFAQRRGHRFPLGLVPPQAAGFLDQAVVHSQVGFQVVPCSYARREDRLRQVPAFSPGRPSSFARSQRLKRGHPVPTSHPPASCGRFDPLQAAPAERSRHRSSSAKVIGLIMS